MRRNEKGFTSGKNFYSQITVDFFGYAKNTSAFAPICRRHRIRELVPAPGKGVTMTVAALSTAGFSQYIAASSNVSASQNAWQSLTQSLAQGNLSAAANAFKTYNQLNSAQTSTSGSSSTASSQLSKDMAALGSAISSGNLSTAQSALATVESDQKSTPSQAITNAESAAAQTVQWVDDLLSLSDSSNSSTSATTIDSATAMLDSAYGLNSSSSTTNPMVALLESKYGDGSTASASSTSSSGAADASTAASTADSSSTVSAPSAVSSGNAGSSASVNVYA
jgi:hypothetical protein